MRRGMTSLSDRPGEIRPYVETMASSLSKSHQIHLIDPQSFSAARAALPVRQCAAAIHFAVEEFIEYIYIHVLRVSPYWLGYAFE